MEKNYQLYHPLLHKTTTSTTLAATGHETNIPSNSPGIIPRLTFVFFIGAISLWANYESSKGFNITILNEAGNNTLASKRFDLFYVSNDEITRLVLRTSQLIEDIIYQSDDINFKKQVNHVIIKLSSRNLTSSTERYGGANKRVVVSSLNEHEYVIEISSLVMEGDGFRKDMLLAVQCGMAEVWLFNGNDSSGDY
ncbi:hypothetical protein LIER_24602 [Lithospermum erythrorhizon]|uniref:Uncharacterized protein n=1 Tax=Lithospermum erythrorhizon TaxID=34254 RepID=A0AAV3R359_LITER